MGRIWAITEKMNQGKGDLEGGGVGLLSNVVPGTFLCILGINYAMLML